MSDGAKFAIVFAYSGILWVVVLTIYSVFIESLDFGALGMFALKSMVLVACVAFVAVFVPFGGFLTLLVWALGLLVIFRMDLWQMRVLVLLIWGVNYLTGLMMRGVLMSGGS